MIYPNKLKNWPIGGFKAPNFNDRKRHCINAIQCRLRSLKFVSFQSRLSANFSVYLGINIKNDAIRILVQLLKSKAVHSTKEKRFLILSTTGLGDTLWATPAIRALRKCFAASYISILTSPIGKELLQHHPHIDELFLVKDPVFPQLLSLYRTLKKRKITHVLNFHTSQRSILPLASILGATEIIGTCGINKGLDFLFTHSLDNQKMHEIQRRLDIITKVGAYTLDSSMEIFLSQEDENMANKFLTSLNIPSCLPLIGFHPGAKDKFKQWPASHFIELGNLLVRNLGCHIIVTGAPQEKALVESIVSQIEGASAATALSLLATAALIKKMDLMISNDTGPMHLSLAVKTPTIGLFTPTNPELCGPYLVENGSSVAKKTTCTPCLRKKCQEPFCLLQIGVEEVYDLALKIFYQKELLLT
jgi:ADP-heptose:LPS heptosyltransferase